MATEEEMAVPNCNKAEETICFELPFLKTWTKSSQLLIMFLVNVIPLTPPTPLRVCCYEDNDPLGAVLTL